MGAGQSSSKGCVSCFLGLTLLSNSCRIRANFDGLPFDICQRPAPSAAAIRLRSERAILSGDGSASFLTLIAQLAWLHNEQSPLNPRIERAEGPFQYIRETAPQYQASERFSALTLPRILSVLSSKLTF